MHIAGPERATGVCVDAGRVNARIVGIETGQGLQDANVPVLALDPCLGRALANPVLWPHPQLNNAGHWVDKAYVEPNSAGRLAADRLDRGQLPDVRAEWHGIELSMHEASP